MQRGVFFLHSICLRQFVHAHEPTNLLHANLLHQYRYVEIYAADSRPNVRQKSRSWSKACRKPARPCRKPGWRPGLQLNRIMECSLTLSQTWSKTTFLTRFAAGWCKGRQLPKSVNALSTLSQVTVTQLDTNAIMHELSVDSEVTFRKVMGSTEILPTRPGVGPFEDTRPMDKDWSGSASTPSDR